MSQDLEHLLNSTAAEPSRPVDTAEITRLARKRRHRRKTGTAIAVVAAAAGLVTVVTVPLQSGAGDVVTSPATDPEPAPAGPDRVDIAEPYTPVRDCPVTEPPTPGFEPPDGYPAEPSMDGAVWFGTEELWTALPVDDEYVQRKSVWWSTSFPGGAEESQPAIYVRWQRLDVATAPVTSNGGQGTNANTAQDGWFMIAGIDPADPGCWQVSARYKGAELSYVYEIPGD